MVTGYTPDHGLANLAVCIMPGPIIPGNGTPTRTPTDCSAGYTPRSHRCAEYSLARTRYTALIAKEDDGYTSLCPELDVASQGSTIEEALDHLLEAVELFLECASPDEVRSRKHHGGNSRPGRLRLRGGFGDRMRVSPPGRNPPSTTPPPRCRSGLPSVRC